MDNIDLVELLFKLRAEEQLGDTALFVRLILADQSSLLILTRFKRML